MRKIIVTIAPVAGKTPEAVVVPLDPSEIANDVISSAEAGAGMVHLHVRDKEGQISEDLSIFSKTLDYIREKSDIVIQGSTGGFSSLSREEKCMAINDTRVEVASLNMGSVNKRNVRWN
jgi:3-keto-5-aminohexanoate cleavage enzyme